MGKVAIRVAKNDGVQESGWKLLEVDTGDGWDAVKKLVANTLYTEMELFIITGPADLTLYAVPGGADVEKDGGADAALAALTDGSQWVLDICGGPYTNLEDVLSKTDEAIIQARDLIGSPIREPPTATGFAHASPGGGQGAHPSTPRAAPAPARPEGTPDPVSDADISAMLGDSGADGPSASKAPAPPSPAAGEAGFINVVSPTGAGGARRVEVRLVPESGGPWFCQCVNHRVQLSADPTDLNRRMEQVRVVEVGQLCTAVQKLRVAGGSQVFYKVALYHGWMYKFDPEGQQVVEEVPEPYFTYQAEPEGPPLPVHDDKGECTARTIPPGTEFEASALVRLPGGQVHYRLSDFSGWVYRYTEVPGVGADGGGSTSEGGAEAGGRARAGSGAAGRPLVREVPNAPLVCKVRSRHVNVRVTADLKSALVEPLRTLSPGETFKASRRIVVPKGGGQRFYKVCGVDGWLFRKLEDGTMVVEEVSKPPLVEECCIQ
eukprot:g1826.t1